MQAMAFMAPVTLARCSIRFAVQRRPAAEHWRPGGTAVKEVLKLRCLYTLNGNLSGFLDIRRTRYLVCFTWLQKPETFRIQGITAQASCFSRYRAKVLLRDSFGCGRSDPEDAMKGAANKVKILCLLSYRILFKI
jgi:hypothetical protein